VLKLGLQHYKQYPWLEGQAPCSVDKKMKVRIMNKEDMSDPKVHYITSEVGTKSGINSAQNTWTGSLKM
jgi:hypothetical protein